MSRGSRGLAPQRRYNTVQQTKNWQCRGADVIQLTFGHKLTFSYQGGERSCEIDDIVSRGDRLPFHGLLCFFPCDPILYSFHFILHLGLVRNTRAWDAARNTCRDSRSSSETISITWSFPLSSLSRLTPFPLFLLPSTFTEGPGESSGGGDGLGDWGIIPCAFSISVTRNLTVYNRRLDHNRPTSPSIKESEGHPRGLVDVIDDDAGTPRSIDAFSKPRWLGELRSLQKLESLRKTVRSSLFGPFVDWPGARCSTAEGANSSIPLFDTSRDFYLDSSYVFVVCVVSGRDFIIVYSMNKGQMGLYSDNTVDEPVVSMGAKM